MSESWLIQPDREKWRTAWVALVWSVSAVVHQFIGLVGIPVLSAFVIFTLCSIARGLNLAFLQYLEGSLLTQIPVYPVQASIGLLTGFVLGRYSQRRIILWIWVLPLILFCLALIFEPMNGSAVFGPYYFSETHHESTLLGRLSWSILFIPSAAYALGAKIAKPHGVKISEA